ncbi:MAG: tRNA preQ1(34) S-adenosylmethionine ribosyltransferase-isomerase QueA [Planctomycetes bacterium]|nr:tRNA preQ1(34) S-adenosylmethionine ribosyltransferase-isomerase QueA [Planctomycetota bacterium]
MLRSDFDFELPPELIAQAPLEDRSSSRLLVLERQAGAPPTHHAFREVVDLLPAGSLLVLNESRVIPARFFGSRASGGKVEVLLTEPDARGGWQALIRCGGTLRVDELLTLEEGQATLRVLERLAGGHFRVEFEAEEALEAAERCGRMPLPPYVKRPATAADRERYQTVFARVPGAIAAPTAGLHFTPELLESLEARGVGLAKVVLHVGLGTFLPVRVDDLSEHVMHSERYEVPTETRARLEAHSGPVIACGTTAVRALEAYAESGAPAGRTELFITPGYSFRAIDGLITNFHLPESTLLMLVAALIGRERLFAAYEVAIAERYRFYSYGDAMLIRP